MLIDIKTIIDLSLELVKWLLTVINQRSIDTNLRHGFFNL